MLSVGRGGPAEPLRSLLALVIQALKSCMGKRTVQVIKRVCIKVHVYVPAEEGVKASVPVWGRRQKGKQIGDCQGAERMWEWVV